MPPVDRLNAIAELLERAGIDQRDAVRELRQIASMLATTAPGIDPHGARNLAYAAQVFESLRLNDIASKLSSSAEVFSSHSFINAMRRMPQR